MYPVVEAAGVVRAGLLADGAGGVDAVSDGRTTTSRSGTAMPVLRCGAEWQLLEEIDFARLSRLNLDISETGEELDSYGFLYPYDRAWDRQPGTKTAEKRLGALERAAYNITHEFGPRGAGVRRGKRRHRLRHRQHPQRPDVRPPAASTVGI